MARNVKLMSLSGSDMTKLLCKLQRTVHFEKTLSASSVYSDYLKGPPVLVRERKETPDLLYANDNEATLWLRNQTVLMNLLGCFSDITS